MTYTELRKWLQNPTKVYLWSPVPQLIHQPQHLVLPPYIPIYNMGYDWIESIHSNAKVLIMSNGIVININVNSATRQLEAILNETFWETGQNLMMTDIGGEEDGNLGEEC